MIRNKLLRSACLLVTAGALSMTQSVLAESKWNISGWINEGLTYYDDGVSSDVVQVSDNGTTLGSRITLSGSTDMESSGITAGFEVILEPQAKETPLINANQSDFDDSNNHDIGVLGNNVHVSGMFGKLTIGKQSMPTDNIAILADPSLTLWSGVSPIFRGSGFTIRGLRDAAGDPIGIQTEDGTTQQLVWGHFLGCLTTPDLQGAGGIGLDCNGIYRSGVRYDLPTFDMAELGTVSIAVGYANDDIYDIAAKYNGQMGRLNAVLHIGYAMNQGPNTDSYQEAQNFQIQGGLMDPVSGLFGSIAYQQEEADGAAAGYGDDTDAFYFKGGIKKAWTSIGDTALYGEYGQYNDQYGALGALGVTGSEVERIGFSVDQYFGDRLIVYGKYENLSLDIDGNAQANNLDLDGEDLHLFTTGLVFFF